MRSKPKKMMAYGLISIVNLLFLISQAGAQNTPTPYHILPYQQVSPKFSGERAQAGEAQTEKIHSETISAGNSPWVRILFDQCHLGKNSYLLLRSEKDGASQKLDGPTLKHWNNTSAFFNGAEVHLSLHIAPGDEGIQYRIRSLMAGERASHTDASPSPESICGTTDNRTASSHPASGRLVPIGCTGWIVSNGGYLTAGHCADSRMQVLEFNVPASSADGTINHPAPQHQYPVNTASIKAKGNGVGNDWCIFSCNPNGSGLLPVERQGAFFRMSKDSNPGTLRITGFGVDGPAPGFGRGGPRNADNQTQQTHSGTSQGETTSGPDRVSWRYAVDTQGGNSGSPIIINGTNTTIGIHTHGGCSSSGGGNNGTSFENDLAENAIQNFPGTNVTYVDNGDIVSTEDGSVFRPYNTIAEGVNAVPTNGTLIVVAGTYNGPITITKPMTIRAPVGAVIISSGSRLSTAEEALRENPDLSTATETESFATVHPNPFTNSIHFDYTLEKTTQARLKIYDVTGREVVTLVDGKQEAGTVSIKWNGRNQNGIRVKKGLYLYLLTIDGQKQAGRIVRE